MCVSDPQSVTIVATTLKSYFTIIYIEDSYMHSKAETTREEEEMKQYFRDRLDLYIMLEKKYGHEKACKILSLYDLK